MEVLPSIGIAEIFLPDRVVHSHWYDWLNLTMLTPRSMPKMRLLGGFFLALICVFMAYKRELV